MADIIKELLPKIKSQKSDVISLNSDYIYPAYDGLSILNIPSSVCKLFGVPEIGAPSINPEILSHLGDNVQRVILILMDALSLHKLKLWILEDKVPVWKDFLDKGILAPITSIVPSTTTSAMTTLWTGRSTTEHGIAGYELLLKEYGVVTNMILQSPATFRGDKNSLTKAGFQPENSLPVSTFGTHLRSHGVIPYSFQHFSISSSGLSQTFLKDVKLEPFGSAAELWVGMRQLLEAKRDEKLYAWVYWGTVDGLSHIYGPDDERPEAEFISFSSSFEHNFLSRLDAESRENTVIILTSDHGQVFTPKKQRFDLRHHPELINALSIYPTGESRFTYLHIRPGYVETVRNYFEHTWPDEFIVVASEVLLEAGLFGPGKPYPQLRDRLGDLIVVAKNDSYLWWSAKENPLLGRHGGLTAEEMLVPFLAIRL